MSKRRCQLVRRDATTLVCSDCGQRVRSPEGGPAVAVICRLQDAPSVISTSADDDDWPRDANGNAKPSDQWESDDLPCVHRGAVLETNLSCDVCGEIGKKYTKYACNLHGECSIIKRKKQGLRFCQRCPDREKPAVERTGPIRVVFLSPGMLRGGAERWIITLCKAWKGDVVATGVVLSDWAGSEPDLVDELTRAGVVVRGGPNIPEGEAKTGIVRAPTVIAAVKQGIAKADVVISWGWGGVETVLRDAGWKGPHVVVSHGACSWSEKLLDGPARTATHVVAVSEAAAKAIPEEERQRARIIWNGIELDRIAPSRPRDEVRASWGCGPDDILIGYVGRLAVSKRPEAVAMAAAELQRRWPDRVVRPVLVGDGSHRDIVLADCREKVGDALVVVPPPDHIGDAYAALDVMMLASPSEGMSLALCEAWAAGVPTVATPVGAVPEIEAKHGELVYRVDVGASATLLADAVEAALAGDRHKHAQQVAIREMTAARMGRRWADWLGEIL